MSIRLDRLSKRFGERIILDRITLEIPEGELFVLLGASGSGKSTLLRLIAGLAVADSGTVTLDGRDVSALPPQKRGTGFVFQNYSIFRHMTVAENIEFGLKIRRMPTAERRRRSEELLDLVGLGGLGARYSDQLSGGQQQRVALARALAYEPRVLLLDEPFGALDVKIRSQLRRTLRDIQHKLQVTTILVTHDQEEAFELGDRIGVIERGHLLEVGAPESLYANPATLFVATFLGAGMVLVGRCLEGRARVGPVSLPIPEEVRHEEGAPVRVLIRPEQVELTEQPQADLPVLGRGELVEQSFVGALRRMRLRLPHLPGTRQVAPPSPFGEESILVDAVAPAEHPAPREAWVGLRDWRILRQSEPRLLVCDEGAGPATALELARRLVARLRGEATVLGVAGETAELEGLRERLRGRAADERFEIRVRAGDVAEQIATAQAEEFYDLVLLGGPNGARVPPVSERLLETATSPLLFARAGTAGLERILICTRVGEPGKADIRLGGWLASRMNSRVTLLHVARHESEVPGYVRAHLEQGVATLRGLDAAGDARIREARSPVEGILAEAGSGYDLIVIGGHGPRSRSPSVRHDVTLEIVSRADRPVLVVPAETF